MSKSLPPVRAEDNADPSQEAESFVFPASSAQRRLWFLDSLGLGKSAYNISKSLSIRGKLDEAALRRAFNELVQRHESLRTSFALEDDRLMQVVATSAEAPFESEDLRAASDPAAEGRRRAAMEARVPFELGRDPLLRALLLRLSDSEHLLVVTVHHIVADGWSMGLLFRDLASIYGREAHGAPAPLPELTIQYADYSEWQREWLTSSASEGHLAYWRDRLSGVTTILELPTDLPRPAEPTFRGGTHHFEISTDLADAARAFARQEGLTPFMVLMAAFQALLFRYTDQRGFLVGTPVAGRAQAEVESVVGMFANTVVFRADLHGSPTFRQLCARVREDAVGAYAHQELPFERVVERLQPERSLSRTPLFQVLLSLQRRPPPIQLPGLDVTLVEASTETAKFDLALDFVEEEGRLHGALEYSADLFVPSTATRMAQHFRRLLEDAVAEPDTPAEDLPLLSAAELEAFGRWSEAERDWGACRPAHELVSAQAERTPEALAVRFEDEELSYAELDARSARLATFLRSRGVERGTLVGLCAERSVEMVVGLLAVLKSGGAYVPLDPHYPSERLAFMLSDSGARVLLTQRHLLPSLPASDAEAIPLDGEAGEAPAWMLCASTPPAVPVGPDDLAYVIYTSGSTGKPKGVAVTHRSLTNFLLSMLREPGLSSADTLLAVTSLSFDIAALEIFLPLCAGARLVAASRDVAADGEELVMLLARSGATVAQATPATWQMLIDAGWTRARTPALRKVLCGGEAMTPTLARALVERADEAWNMYGPTETTIWSSVDRVGREALERVSIGRSIANTTLYVLDRRLRPAPVGVQGELWIGGDGLARGYLGRPELTADKFRPDPFRGGGARMYCTGDLARVLSDGRLECLGRTDHQVKLRGFRIELGEIEAALAAHPAVRQAAVQVREGQSGEKRLVAYFVPGGAPPEPSTLRAHLKSSLPEYMIPSAFVPLEAMPLTPNGKTDRKALPAADLPAGEEREYVAPRTETEQTLAEIWAEVLRLPRVGVLDNFFELGGDSVASVQVVVRARRRGLRVTPKLMLQAQTIAELARGACAEREEVSSPPSRPETELAPRLRAALGPAGRDVEDAYPLAPIQEGILFHSIDAPGADPYIQQLVGEIGLGLDPLAFERAWDTLVAAHGVLRTSFHWEGVDEPVQVVHRPPPIPWERLDWRALSDAELEAELASFLERDRAKGFRLDQAPLARLTLVETARGHIFVWSHHHLLYDGWSLPLLVSDLFTAYAAHRRGEEPALPSRPPYREYIRWVRTQDTSRAEAFWRPKLEGVREPTSLGEVGPEHASRYADERLELSAEASAALTALARKVGVTPSTIVHAAWARLLAVHTGAQDVIFGSTVSGRSAPLGGIDAMVGMFLNALPTRVRAPEGKTTAEFLRNLHRDQVEAREFEHVPLAKVQSFSDVPPGRQLFETLVVFENFPSDLSDAPSLDGVSVVRGRLLGFTNYPLTLIAVPGPRLRLELKFDAGRFTPEASRQMLAHLARLMGAMAERPQGLVGDLWPLTDAERAALERWNATAFDFGERALVHELVSAQAKRKPQAPAVLFEDESLTYGELDARSDRLASHLASLGVGRGTLVGLCLERSLEMVVGLLGVLKAGGAYVPLDPGYPPERLAFMLSDSGAGVLLTQQRLLSSLPPFEGLVLALDGDAAEAWGRDDGPPPAHRLGPDDLAYVIYTSGSTGRPKGAMNSHGGLRNRLLWGQRTFGLDASDAVLQKTPFSFDISVWEFFWPLIVGARLVVARPEGHRDSGYLVEAIHRYGVTTIHFVPPMLDTFLQDPDARSCTSLRRVICSGEALPYELTRRFFTCFSAELHNLYGPTEASIESTWWPCERDAPGPSVPIGSPLANTTVHVLDARMRPTPPGVAGELYLGGVQLARGYLGRPDLTAERFVPDPFSSEPGARLYRTGDLCRMHRDGAVEYLGRIDHQVKLRGFRIELGEIEAALVAHPRVRQAVAVVREDRPGEKRLVAYFVFDGTPPPASELHERLSASLPEYMIPSAFVPLEAMPLTPNGKTDRKALPAPELPAGEEREHVAPRTEAEQTLAGIWAEVLRLPRVGVLDNFFELGGDSILGIQISARARAAGLGVAPRDLFLHPTVEALAAVSKVVRRRAAGSEAEGGTFTLTPVQRWFFERYGAAPNHFNQAVMLEFTERADRRALEASLAAVVEHHDALRLRFSTEEEAVTQAFADEGTWPLEIVDLSGRSASAQQDGMKERADEVQARLDVRRGPSGRALLFDLGPDSPERLLLVLHHLVVDGVSWRVLLEDLAAAYARALRGEPANLPPKTTSFRAWAERLTEHAHSKELEAELSYWRELATRPTFALPTDASGENVASSSSEVRVHLEAGETRRLLRDLPREHSTEINEVLLLALGRALSRWAGRRGILIDLEGHGREDLFAELDVTRTIGWFTSIFPVHLDVDPALPPPEALRAVRNELRAIPSRGMGFGLLRYLRPDAAEALRSAGGEVVFNYLGQLDHATSGPAPFRPGAGPLGRRMAPELARTHLLEILAAVREGRLEVRFTFSENLHRRETIAALADDFVGSLRDLLAASSTSRGRSPSGAIADLYPLSPMQRGMLYHALRDQASGLYVQQLHWKVDGELSASRLRQAWEHVIRRHDVLRTSFDWRSGADPVQLVREDVPLAWEEEDWGGLSAAEQDARLERLLEQDRKRGFDLTEPPLMRLRLLRLGEREHRILWTHHHLLLDGWSVAIVLREVLAKLLDEAAALPAVKPYRRFVDWLGRRDPAVSEAFWKRRMAGALEPTLLPPAPSVGAPGGYASVSRAFGEPLAETLRTFTRKHGLTTNTLLLGAFSLVLARLTGRDEVVFGVTGSGRTAPMAGLEEMVGLFINTLPVRVQTAALSSGPTWLRALQEQQSEQREFEHTSLADVQRWAGVPGGQPLFDAVFVFENYPVDAALRAPPGAGVRITESHAIQRTNYPLTVGVEPRDLRIEAVYDRSRVDAEVAEALLVRVEAAARFLADGRAPAQLDLLTEGERRNLLSSWNDSAVPRRSEGVDVLFAEAVRRHPHAEAVAQGGRTLTYEELDRRSNQLARHLRALGAGRGATVGLCLQRSPELVVAVLGVLKAGAAYLPLDPTYPRERLGYMLEDARPALLISAGALFGLLSPGEAPRVLLDSEWPAIARRSDAPLDVRVAPEDPAYVIYTSGSTGKPKGTVLHHRGLVNLALAQIEAFGIRPGSRILQFAALGFDASVSEMFTSLLAGATLILPEEDESRATFAPLVRREAVNVVTVPPSLLAALSPTELPSLETLVCAGEACSAEVVARWGKGLRMLNAYGPTEVTVCATIAECQPDEGAPPIGRPIDNVRVYVLDRRMGLAPVGAAGELYVGGHGVGVGYLGRPDLTAERFVPDPFSGEPGARLYRTGDLARFRPDGQLQFLGRRDEQVKLRGHRVELGEVEALLAATPGVREIAVVAVKRGGDLRLVAHVVEDGAAPAAELKRALRGKLPEYMVPSDFVTHAILPRTSSGKIDRLALARLEVVRPEADGTAPRDEVEKRLAEIWGTLLGGSVPVDRDFFDLGGHSLLALRLVGEIERAFGISLPLSSILEHGTVERLAILLRAPAPSSALVSLRAGDERPPIVCVPPVGGELFGYRELLRKLASGRPTLGLTCPEGSTSSVEVLAAHYLSVLGETSVTSPCLLGWSFGGLVAFEMARQLREAGGEIERLALIDPHLADSAELAKGSSEDEPLLGLLGDLAGMAGQRPTREDRARLLALPAPERIEAALAWARAKGALPTGVGPSELRRQLSTYQANVAAARRYAPRPADIAIVLFQAADGPPGRASAARQAFSALALRGVEVLEIPGDHYTMMQGKNAEVLGAALSSRLGASLPLPEPRPAPSPPCRQELRSEEL